MNVIYCESSRLTSIFSGSPVHPGLGRVLLIALFCVAALSRGYAQVPSIISLAPESGAAGTSVLISGSNFSATLANNVVFFGAVRAAVTAATATSLTVTVPYGATEQPVSVMVGGSTGVSRLPFRVTFTGGAGAPLDATVLGTPIAFTAGSSPRGVAISDIDGDGKPDLVAVNNGANTVSVFRNAGVAGAISTSSFASKVDFATEAAPISVAVGDLDGDGKPDLAVSTLTNSSISVFKNTSTSGTVSFDVKVDVPTATSPRSVAIGDFDADGKPELITVGSTNRVFIHKNLATTGTIDNATFSAATQFFANTSPETVVVGDIDNDGKPDLVVSHTGGGSIAVLRNTRISGTFAFASAVNVAVETTSNGNVMLSDLDGDGKLDIALAGLTSKTVYLYRNTSTPGLPEFELPYEDITNATDNISYVAAGDYDGDGKPDLIMGTLANGIYISRNQTTVGNLYDEFSAPFKVALGTPGTTNYGLVVGDLNADGKADVVAGDNAGSRVLVLENRVGAAALTPQTITFGALTSQDYGSTFNLTATASSGLTVTYTSSNTSVATISGNTVTVVGVGSTNITASQAGNGTYAAATPVVQALTTTKADQTITFAAIPGKTFGDAAFTLGATASSGLTVSYSSSNTGVATISGNTVTIVGAGTTTITATQAGNANYNAATAATRDLTVSKQAQTITFAAIPGKTFGDAAFTLGATASSGLAVSYSSSNTGVATISGNTVAIVGAGTTTITATQAGNANYNAATAATRDLTVSKQAQTITFAAIPGKTFGDAAFTLGATASSGLAVSYSSSNTGVATVSGSTVTIVGAGTSTITATQAGNANYNAATAATRDLTVSKQAQTITFAAIPGKTVGGAAFTLGATASSGLAVSYSSSNTGVATVIGNTVTIVGAGTTTITATQAGNGNYNAATAATQDLTVSKQAQTITFDALTAKPFGSAFNPGATASSGLTVTYVSSNTSVATVSGTTVTVVGVGSTNITASQAGNATYAAATAVVRALTTTKADQTITFAAIPNKTMGDANFTLGATASSSLAVSYSSSNTSVATVNGSGTVTIVGAGTTTITASQSGNANYNAAPIKTQDLVVSKKTQTITFNALPNKTLGDANFNLTATASSALVVSYSSSNTAVATISGNTVTVVGVGTTTITASQAGNASFAAAAPVERTLNVLPVGGQPVSQTISFGELTPVNVGDGPFTLAATASSGLAVAYTSSNPGVATISGTTLTVVAAGQTQITASQAGNAVFAAATPVVRTLVVHAVVATEHEAPGVVSIYPNPTSDRVTIVASRFNQQSAVQVALIDTYGRVVVREALRANSEKEIDLSISSLNDGVYILHVTQGALEFRNRIVKIR